MSHTKGGDKFEAYMRQMSADLSKGTSVKVGFLASAKYPSGESVALIAAIQNWGAPAAGIPPRPFFSNLLALKGPTWGAALGELLKSNSYDAAHALRMAGEGIAGQLRQSIIDTNDPPLAPATVARKGFSKPLVDTGHMLQSVDYEVKE